MVFETRYRRARMESLCGRAAPGCSSCKGREGSAVEQGRAGSPSDTGASDKARARASGKRDAGSSFA